MAADCPAGPLAALVAGPFAYALGARSRVRVTGADRLRYLDGQLSNSLRDASEDRAIQALLLTPKGKLCARVFVWLEGEAVVLDAEPELHEELMDRLGRYAVADDVVFDDAFIEDAGWHVCGASDGLSCARLGGAGADCADRPPGIAAANPDDVEAVRIARGVPAWGAELDGTVLPQEAGLDRAAVDFHKGCYVGQEVVSRIQSVGHTNRRLRGVQGDFRIASGATLHANGRELGRITSAVRHLGLPATLALAYVSTKSDASAFEVRDPAGDKLGDCITYELPLF